MSMNNFNNISSLASDNLVSILLFDLSKNTYREMYNCAVNGFNISSNEYSGDTLATYYADLARDDYKSKVSKFADASNFKTRIAEDDSQCEFVSKSYGWCRLTIQTVEHDDNNKPTAILLVVVGINETKNKETNLWNQLDQSLESAQVYREAFYSQALMLYNVNLTQDILENDLTLNSDNKAYSLLPMVGMDAPCSFTEFIKKWSDFALVEEDKAAFVTGLNTNRLINEFQKGVTKVHVDHRTKSLYADSKTTAMRNIVTISENENGDIIARCIVEDVTKQIEQEQKLRQELQKTIQDNERLKFTDELTGCPNKQGFFEQVKKILRQNSNKQYCLCYSDINNLGYVNSYFGYDVGNELIKHWIEYTKSSISNSIVIGRISGDYFATLVAIDDDEKRQALDNEYSSVIKKVNEYFSAFDKHFKIQIYTGIYLIMPDDVKNMPIHQMINNAAIAQKQAKDKHNPSPVFYNENQWKQHQRGIQISQYLSTAIANGEIEAWLQPQYDYTKMKIVGAEVLSRWNSPTLGRLSPAEFIPVLEESGQIYELDRYIWEQACKYLRNWLDTPGHPVVPLSVNISRRNVSQENLVANLTNLMNTYDLSPDYLRLEITESAYLDGHGRLVSIVRQLIQYGFMLEMDDFGSGYSSLSILREVPVNTLKLDLRFLISGEDESLKKGGNIVSAVIRMAQSLNMSVIAEGIETKEQADILKNMGCTLMQGFYFAKPMVLSDFEELIRIQKTGRRSTATDDANLACIYDIMDTHSKSSYIFNHYSAASAIAEFDGETLEIMCINDEFLRTMGDTDGSARAYMSDGLALVDDSDKPKAIATIKKALAEGRASCELYLPQSQQWVKVTYRHVFSTNSSDYFFCDSVNTTDEHRLEYQVENLTNELHTELDLMPAGAFKYSADGDQEFVYVSEGMLHLLNYPSLDAFKKKFNNSFINLVYKEDRERVLSEIDDQIHENGEYDYCEYRIETGDGKLKWVYDHGRLITDDNGKKWFYVVIADMGVNKRKSHEKEVQVQKYQTLAYLPGIHTFEYNIKDDSLTVNKSDENGEIQTIVIEDYLKVIEDKNFATKESIVTIRKAFKNAIKMQQRGVFKFVGRFIDEGFHRYRCHYVSVTDEYGKIKYIVGNAIETDNDENELALWKSRAQRDTMTGLLNHNATIQQIDVLRLENMCGTMIMMDVDNFKQINDTQGHLFGDEVLKQISKTLTENFRVTDVIGRFGGDEFLIYMLNTCDKADVKEKMTDLKQALGEIDAGNGEKLKVSIGCAIDRFGEISTEELIHHADNAMYKIKSNGKNYYHIFTVI